jgi:hypothetical protein
MSLASGRGSALGQMAPTCYVASVVTGECYAAPTTLEPLQRGLVASANTAYVLPGFSCGANSQNSGIPCGGNTYCSNYYLGVCTPFNSLTDPRVDLRYVNYGSRLP